VGQWPQGDGLAFEKYLAGGMTLSQRDQTRMSQARRNHREDWVHKAREVNLVIGSNEGILMTGAFFPAP